MSRFMGILFSIFTGALLLPALTNNCATAEDASLADMSAHREAMVAQQIEARGVRDPRVLAAFRKIPRELFLPVNRRSEAYDDNPVSIGEDQTISRPYIVAYMTEQLELKGNERVLEIGTGSGYQAAVLAELAREVDTIEILPDLSSRAQSVLKQLGYKNIHFKVGDGWAGWSERAPYDAIILTAAPPKLPPPLLAQLKDGGRLIAPVGSGYQELVRIRRKGNSTSEEHLIPVRFVPMTGEAQTASLRHR